MGSNCTTINSCTVAAHSAGPDLVMHNSMKNFKRHSIFITRCSEGVWVWVGGWGDSCTDASFDFCASCVSVVPQPCCSHAAAIVLLQSCFCRRVAVVPPSVVPQPCCSHAAAIALLQSCCCRRAAVVPPSCRSHAAVMLLQLFCCNHAAAVVLPSCSPRAALVLPSCSPRAAVMLHVSRTQ
jgi:hypothetical protein